jgi:hypothetical protein
MKSIVSKLDQDVQIIAGGSPLKQESSKAGLAGVAVFSIATPKHSIRMEGVDGRASIQRGTGALAREACTHAKSGAARCPPQARRPLHGMHRRDRVGIARCFNLQCIRGFTQLSQIEFFPSGKFRVNLLILFTLEQRLRFSTRLILVPLRSK